MAIRYYICDRLTGGIAETTYHSSVEQWVSQNLGVPHDGSRQLVSHAIPITIERYDLTTAQHNALMAALPAAVFFPQTFLATTFAELTPAQRTGIQDRLDAFGFDTSWGTGATTIRQLLKAIYDSVQLAEKISALINVQLNVAVFNVGNKTVGDLTAGQKAKLLELLSILGITANGTNATPLQEVVDLIRISARIKGFE